MACTVSSTVNSLARRVLGHREAQLQVAAPHDDVLEHLVDRVLVDARPAGDQPPHLAADARDERGGRHVAGELRRVGEQPAQVAVVEVRAVHAVVPPLPPVVLAQRPAHAAAGASTSFAVDEPAAACRRSSRISSSMYSSFLSAGQPAYRCAQSLPGVSHTANVSAKSSSGWLCAYHESRCSTKLLLYGFGA